MVTKHKNTAWHRIRNLFNDIHLWLGLISGLIIFIVCLSGTIYTYNTEIRELASPHLHRVKAEGTKMRIDEIVNNIQRDYPGTVTAITIPNDPSRSYEITSRTVSDKSRFGVTYYINPYSGALLGTNETKTKIDELMGNLFSLHRWLLLDKIEQPIFSSLENRKLGSYITGTATILFTLGLLTGLIIWFPRKIKNWKQGLKIRFNSNWKRINHDMHNSLGMYAFVFLFLMGITGPQWSFQWYKDGLRKILGTYQEIPTRNAGINKQGGQAASKKSANYEDTALLRLSIEDYLASASSALNYNGDYRLSFPASNDEPIRISCYKTGFFASAAADQIMLNVSDASIVSMDLFKDKPFNERISGSIKALHVGNIYGQFSKLIYFIACLIATSLPVTGTLIWINKMKKSKKKVGHKKREAVIASQIPV